MLTHTTCYKHPSYSHSYYLFLWTQGFDMLLWKKCLLHEGYEFFKFISLFREKSAIASEKNCTNIIHIISPSPSCSLLFPSLKKFRCFRGHSFRTKMRFVTLQGSKKDTHEYCWNFTDDFFCYFHRIPVRLKKTKLPLWKSLSLFLLLSCGRKAIGIINWTGWVIGAVATETTTQTVISAVSVIFTTHPSLAPLLLCNFSRGSPNNCEEGKHYWEHNCW